MHFVIFSCQLLGFLRVFAFSQAYIQISQEYLNDILIDRAQDRAAGEYNYDYNGDDWTGLCQIGQSQSPIDLLYDDAIKNNTIPRIQFHHYGESLRTPLVLMNNGHTANMVIPPTRTGQRPFITGGLLRGEYEVQSVHFHWGSNSSKGSEHSINFMRYDVEMHIVHKNRRYESMAEASQNADGLAVLAVMFGAQPQPFSQYYGLNKIFNQLPRIVEYNTNTTIPGQLNMAQLLGNIIVGVFYSYNGSLTTPDCAEAVTWTVFPDVINIPERHIMKFWQLKDSRGTPLINNYRTIQDTNQRPVYYRGVSSLFL
ncbi:carbonic anhydrase 2-like [Scaptodrosophila lebanonensis]|uniref:Carbonic anhydrase n=1 Tax=Drosophila lebanonensis TaxID=7225 RepID=A0A6J2TLD0_DROLE|nr:carbonic anhydrase 2-like [Scaptodrosophila lebanonensis]